MLSVKSFSTKIPLSVKFKALKISLSVKFGNVCLREIMILVIIRYEYLSCIKINIRMDYKACNDPNLTT